MNQASRDDITAGAHQESVEWTLEKMKEKKQLNITKEEYGAKK
jgi:hypothetical protein